MIEKKKEEILKGFSKTQLEGLKLLFDEEIEKLKELETITSFEEMLGKKIAIQTLKEIMRKLNLFKEKKVEKNKNEYI